MANMVNLKQKQVTERSGLLAAPSQRFRKLENNRPTGLENISNALTTTTAVAAVILYISMQKPKTTLCSSCLSLKSPR